MKASTLFLGVTLVALAASLAGLWQAFGPRPSQDQTASPPAIEAPARRPKPLEPKLAEPTEPGVRSVYPGGRPTAAARPAAPDSPPPGATARQAPQEPIPPPEQAPAPERSAALPQAPAEEPSQTPPVEPTAGEGIDLNSAPVEALNGLGAGMIGKTIVANRPYASPDDLVTRRVLKRQDYEIIRPHVVAR